MWSSIPSPPAWSKPRGWTKAQDGVNVLPHPQEAQEGGLDQEALSAMQDAWGGHTKVTTHVTAVAITRMVLLLKNGGSGKPHSKERKPEGMNFAQIFQTELRKALRKKSSKCKRCCDRDLESDSDSNNSSWRRGSGRTGELHTCKKHNQNTAVNS
jgi:hypothetical protein